MSRRRHDADSTEITQVKRRRAAIVSSQSNDVSNSNRSSEDWPMENIRSGKILKIHLINFMCHSNLMIDFNERVNIMIGNNGSGKSAILTALVIGLGCKASSTNRSNSIKQLIKQGEDSTTIEIHLLNEGIDAYEQETYGNKIIVNRRITAAGASTYKLINENGNVVSKHRNDLLKLALYLNIQVDNPVCVLNQDASRSFLKDSDPKQQYQLFLKATQIDVILSKLQDCTMYHKQAEYHLSCRKKVLEHLSEELEGIQDKFQRLKSVEYIKKKLVNSQKELGWLKVEEVEKSLNNATRKLETELQNHESLVKEFENRGSLEKTIMAKINTLSGDLGNKRSIIADTSKECDKFREIYNSRNDTLAEQSRKWKSFKSKKVRLENDIKQLETDIAQRADDNQIQKLKSENEKKLLSFSTRKNEIDSIISNLRRDVDMLVNTIEQMRELVDNEKHRKQNLSYQIEKKEHQIRQIDDSSGNNLSIYGQHMPRLIEKIEKLSKQGRFTKLPRGPLGRYIEVRDQKFRDCIENELGALLISFYVNSDQDRKLLDIIMREEFPQAPKMNIITGKFVDKLYNVHEGMVRQESNTHVLYKLLKVDDPVVMNCVIDQSRVETILLVEDEDLATHLTSEEENVPKNLTKIILTKPFSEYFPAPLYRSYSINLRPARYLQKNLTDLRNQNQHELNQLQQKVPEIEQIIKQENNKLIDNTNVLRDKKSKISKLEQELTQIKLHIEEINQIEYPPDNEAEILENELQQLRANVPELERQIETEHSKISAIETEVAESENILKQSQQSLKMIQNETSNLQKEIDKLNTELFEMNRNVMYHESQVKNLTNTIKGIQTEVNTIKQEMTRTCKEAQKLGDRVEVKHSESDLQKKIKDSERQILKICSTKENLEDVEKLLEIKQQNHEYNVQLVETIEKTLDKFQNSRITRYQRLSKLKQYMTIRIHSHFLRLLKVRDYAGDLIIDHKNQTLQLSVVPRDKNISNAVSNTKSLSGGERSFSTVAFLLSLWTCIDHPFFFLDEYDVFTDQVNRHIMTKLLINEAMKRSDRQFFFLTPQDMSSIAATDLITIHKMADPKKCVK